MLNLYCTPLTSDYHRELAQSIEKSIAAGVRTYLIVPEQQTVESESDLSYRLPPDAPLYFEVTNFTRFANTTFRAIGGIGGETCDKSRRALIMWRTLTELSPVLSMTESGREVSSGLVDTAMRAVSEMQSEGITPELLAEAASRSLGESQRRLSAKLRDVSKIYSLYKKLLSEKYSDSQDELELAMKKLSERGDFLRGAHIFVEGFTSFTEPQYRLLATLAERCSVDVILPLPKALRDSFEYTETRSALERLKAHARRKSVDVRQIFTDGRRPEQSEVISELANRIWRKNTEFDNNSLQNNGEIRIFEASTPYEECDFICADIKRRIMEGAAYGDIAVILGGTSELKGILESSMLRRSIPAFLSEGRDLSSFEAIKLIYTAYSVILSDFRREDVITYAKCSLGSIPREDCDEFEIYVNTWQISGRRFTDGMLWNMNPRGYTAKREATDSEKLIRINNTREAIVSTLLSFKEDTDSASTVRAHAEALYAFLRRIGLEDALRAKAEKLGLLGEGGYAEEYSRLWGLICNALDTLVEVSGDMPSSRESFLGQLKILFSSTSISSIPQRADEVTVGSMDMLRLYGKKHVYIVGTTAGSIPAAPTDSSYFSEKDKLILGEIGLALEPQLEIKNARESFIISRAISYANETVTFSYSRTNTKFKGVERSPVINAVTELVSGVPRTVISELPTEERLWFAEDALGVSPERAPDSYGSVREALVRTGYSDRLAVVEGSISAGRAELGEDIRREIYGRSVSLTETRINSFTSCPLSYFCRFVLKLSEEKSAVFDASGVGSFVHAILESFFETLSASNTDAETLTPEERLALTRRAAEGYVRELGESLSEGNIAARVKVERLSRAAYPIVEGLCDELRASAFRPKFFELPIGMGDGPEAITVKAEDGSTVKVYGVVDRVDSYTDEGKTYLRVIDYKTGQKDFSPEDIDRGENLQMFLYLKALVESKNEDFRARLGLRPGERAIPAGVIYVKTSVSDVEVAFPDDGAAIDKAKSEIEREGMVSSDESIVAAMGLRYTPLFSKRTPDRIPDSKRHLTFDAAGWDSLMTRVERSLAAVASRMRSGDVSASPTENKKKKTHCEYCEFKPICRNAVI